MLKPGIMMDRPLLLSGILEHAAVQFGGQEVVSRETHGPLFRYTYAECAQRSRKLANALQGLNLKAGSVVGSIAWNNHRHLEAYYAVSGSGMVMHTCNPRLHPQQLIYIINHAEDEVVLFDITFAPLIKGIAAHCPKVRAWVCLTDREHMPDIEGVANVLSYDELIAPASDVFEWPEFDEKTGAAICYTSGTTGRPKGAVSTHRALISSLMAFSARNTIFQMSGTKLKDVDGPEVPTSFILIVPLFHVTGCVPVMLSCFVAGLKLAIMYKWDPEKALEMIEREQITNFVGVPTQSWDLVNSPAFEKYDTSSLRAVGGGGAPSPTSLVGKVKLLFNGSGKGTKFIFFQCTNFVLIFIAD